MKVLKICRVLILAGIMMTLASEIGEHFSISGVEVVPTVEARVGRPLTPVSVAGVARRTVRRCAVGVYNCSLPGSHFQDNLTGQDCSRHLMVALR